MFLLGMSVNPAVKAVLGIAVLVVGVLMHLVLIDAIGAALILLAAGQLLRRRGAR
jgi:hypothetical protein